MSIGWHRSRRAGWLAFLCLAVTGPVPCPAQGGEPAGLARIEGMIQAGQLAAAEKALRSHGAEGSSAHTDYLLGFTLLQLYRAQEAEAALRRAVDRKPDDPTYLHALAKALLEQSKNLAAIDALDRAIALDDDPDFRFAKAMCALNVGDLETAERELKRCLIKNRQHAEALYKLGKLRIDRGDDSAALDPLRDCLAARPDHLEARFLYGLAASRTGDPEAAVAAFEAVLEKVPGHVGVLYNLGRVLIQQGRREEGTRRLEAFRSMSKLRDAIDFTTRAVKKNPTNLPGRLELGRLLLEAGRTEDALEELLAARQLGPGEPHVYRLLAEAFERLGRAEDAERAAAFARRLEGQGG